MRVPKPVWMALFLVGFLATSQLDRVWAERSGSPSALPPKPDGSKPGWPPLAATFALGCGLLGMRALIRSWERDADANPPKAAGSSWIGQALRCAARMIGFVFVVLIAGMVWVNSIVEASRRPGWPGGHATRIITGAGLLFYVVLTTYWGARLFRLLSWPRGRPISPQRRAVEAAEHAGVWDRDVDGEDSSQSLVKGSRPIS